MTTDPWGAPDALLPEVAGPALADAVTQAIARAEPPAPGVYGTQTWTATLTVSRTFTPADQPQQPQPQPQPPHPQQHRQPQQYGQPQPPTTQLPGRQAFGGSRTGHPQVSARPAALALREQQPVAPRDERGFASWDQRAAGPQDRALAPRGVTEVHVTARDLVPAQASAPAAYRDPLPVFHRPRSPLFLRLLLTLAIVFAVCTAAARAHVGGMVTPANDDVVAQFVQFTNGLPSP